MGGPRDEDGDSCGIHPVTTMRVGRGDRTNTVMRFTHARKARERARTLSSTRGEIFFFFCARAHAVVLLAGQCGDLGWSFARGNLVRYSLYRSPDERPTRPQNLPGNYISSAT